MNKKEMISYISSETNINKNQVDIVVNTLLSKITSELHAGETVTFVGFGSFISRSRGGRAGVNPKTKQKIQVPTVMVPAFKPGKPLKDLIKTSPVTSSK